MAEIDSHLPGRPGELGKTMGYRAKANRRRHIYAWRKSRVERAWTGTDDEAAYFRC